MLRRALAPLILVLFCAPLFAEEPPLASEVTERGRSLAHAVERLVVPRKSEAGADRTVWLLIDVTDSLRRSPFADLFADTVELHAERLAHTRIGVALVGADGGPALMPTTEHGRAVAEVRTLLTRPAKTFQNVYADVRRLATAPATGRREIVLVSLENGDAEDEVDAVAAALKRSDTRLSAIAREAFLSDSYWVTHESFAPRRLTMNGGDSAFLQLPWGWLFQQGNVNEVVPSGFAMYGITRLAAASGGTVWLYYPPSNATVGCALQGYCPFCANDQIGAHEFYESHKLRALSPIAGSRAEVLGAAARDPYLKAMLAAWGRASKEGLTFSRPAVRPGAGSLRPERRQTGNPTNFGRSLSFAGQASKADKAATVSGRLADELAADIEAVEEGSGRFRAEAEFTVLLLRLTRLNLLYYAAFCREVGPEYVRMASEQPALPQLPLWGPEQVPTGIHWTSMALSHGVPPFYALRLPGGESTDGELREFAGHFHAFVTRYAKTPFAEAARQSGIARFQVTFRGKAAPPPGRTPRSSEKDDETTSEPERPSRGGGGSGSGGGTTSGGK